MKESPPDRQTARTDLGQLHELLGGRHHNLWLHLIAEAVGDVGVAVIEQLADDQLVQLLTVLQRWFLAIHVEQTGRRTLTTALWETDDDSMLTFHDRVFKQEKEKKNQSQFQKPTSELQSRHVAGNITNSVEMIGNEWNEWMK